MFVIVRCKREGYLEAWNHMYQTDKEKFASDPLFDTNPMLNRHPLGTETDNFCTVVYDSLEPAEGFKYGKPVGIFCVVVTPKKAIGKPLAIHPDYHGKGLRKAIIIETEKALLESGHEWYYIGCSNSLASIYLYGWGVEPFSSDEKADMYKFNVSILRENFGKLYSETIENNPDIMNTETFELLQAQQVKSPSAKSNVESDIAKAEQELDLLEKSVNELSKAEAINQSIENPLSGEIAKVREAVDGLKQAISNLDLSQIHQPKQKNKKNKKKKSFFGFGKKR